MVTKATSTGKALSKFKKEESKNKEHYGIDNFKLEILQRSRSHIYFLTGLKYFFNSISIVVAFTFWR